MDYIVALGSYDDYEPLIWSNTSLVLDLGLGMVIDLVTRLIILRRVFLLGVGPNYSNFMHIK